MPNVTMRVEKYLADGRFSFSWQGRQIAENSNSRTLDALFNGRPGPLGRVRLETGDRFIETYFTDRWYNIFEIYPAGEDRPKVWYYNISQPARFAQNIIQWLDLALDVLVYPDGSATLLDLDEFGVLDLDLETQRECWRAVARILAEAKLKQPSREG